MLFRGVVAQIIRARRRQATTQVGCKMAQLNLFLVDKAWCCGKPLIWGPAGRASGRGAAQTRHGRAAPPRGELRPPRGPTVRRRGDLAAARASASSARSHQGASVARGPRGQQEWNALRLVIFFESPPDFTSDRRPLPTLTPARLTPSSTRRTPRWHLVGHPGWWGGARPRVYTSPPPPWRGTATTTQKGALPRVKPIPHPLPPPTRMY